MMLMTLAALGSVPAQSWRRRRSIATLFQRLRLVILHHGKFILMLGILLRTIDGFKTIDLIFDMTYGGPGQATKLVAIDTVQEAFESFNMGWSSAWRSCCF